MFQCVQLSASLENSRVLFPPFDFSLKERDRLAIISEEGNGKSTLLKIISNIPCDYVHVSGKIISNYKVAYLPQKIEEKWNQSFPLDFLLKEKPEDEILPEQYNLCQKLESLCSSMYIDSNFIYTERPIYTLSGGEKVDFSS